MGEAEWRLTATAMTMLALAVTGYRLVRSMWLGRPIRVRRYRSAILVEVAAGLLLAWPAPVEETVVASAVVASAVETQSCAGSASIASYQPHGERLHIVGAGQLGAACAIWAIVEDVAGGGLWLQGPATMRDAGWDVDLVLGTGTPHDSTLRYRVNLVSVSAAAHDAWKAAARPGAAVRLSERPPGASWLVRDLRLELRSCTASACEILAVAR